MQPNAFASVDIQTKIRMVHFVQCIYNVHVQSAHIQQRFHAT